MTVDEVKKILRAAELSPHVREALNVLLPDLDFENLPGEEWLEVIDEENEHKGAYQISAHGRAGSFKQGKVKFFSQILDMKAVICMSVFTAMGKEIRFVFDGETYKNIE